MINDKFLPFLCVFPEFLNIYFSDSHCRACYEGLVNKILRSSSKIFSFPIHIHFIMEQSQLSRNALNQTGRRSTPELANVKLGAIKTLLIDLILFTYSEITAKFQFDIVDKESKSRANLAKRSFQDSKTEESVYHHFLGRNWFQCLWRHCHWWHTSQWRRVSIQR